MLWVDADQNFKSSSGLFPSYSTLLALIFLLNAERVEDTGWGVWVSEMGCVKALRSPATDRDLAAACPMSMSQERGVTSSDFFLWNAWGTGEAELRTEVAL